MVTPGQYPRARSLGPKSASRLAHSIFLTSQRPLHRTLHPPRRNRHEQSNDPPPKLLLQTHHVNPLHHPLHLRHPLRCHVCISIALPHEPRCRLARPNPLQRCMASTRPSHKSPLHPLWQRRNEKATVIVLLSHTRPFSYFFYSIIEVDGVVMLLVCVCYTGLFRTRRVPVLFFEFVCCAF